MKKQSIFLTLVSLSFLHIQNAYSQLYDGNAYYDNTGKVYYYADDGNAYYYPEEVQRQYQRNRLPETDSGESLQTTNNQAKQLNYASYQKNNMLDADWWKTTTLESVKDEIAKVSNINAKNEQGFTAIMLATRYNGNPEVIETLIKAGADIYSLGVLSQARQNNNQKVTNFVISEIEKSYREADSSDRSDFELSVSGCILEEKFEQDFRSSLSIEDQFTMGMASLFSLGMKDTQRTTECQCIFNAVQAYLGESEYKKARDAFNQGRQGTFKKAVKKAIPAAFGVCF